MSASLPFNVNRSGAVISEGASMLLLEEEEHAKNRGATILGLIDGFGEAGGPGERTELSTEHLFRSVKLALARIRQRDDRKHAYLAHATSTSLGDPGEIAVILRLMDELGIDLEGRVDTPKVRWMHQLGATGATASIEALELIERGEFPPVNGADTPATEDREATHNGEIEPELRDVIGNGSKKEVDTVVVVGSGFGNQNGAVVIERYEEAA
jgi:3-oxoacyl-[acyl-carrier-protein] synthase II